MVLFILAPACGMLVILSTASSRKLGRNKQRAPEPRERRITPPNRAPVDKQSTERLLKFICAALAVEPRAVAKLYRVEEWRPVQVEVTRLARDLSSGRASCEACKMKHCLVWQPAAMGTARVRDPDNHLHAIALSLWITHFPVALLNQRPVHGKIMIQCSPSVIHPVI